MRPRYFLCEYLHACSQTQAVACECAYDEYVMARKDTIWKISQTAAEVSSLLSDNIIIRDSISQKYKVVCDILVTNSCIAKGSETNLFWGCLGCP